MVAPLPLNEEARLAALHAYEILDTDPERDFDDLARIASHIWATPVALISLVDRDRQWFKARIGLSAAETHRDFAFCAHTILGHETLIVPDATADSRFAENPLVLEDPAIRFYAGSVLQTSDGHPLGTLCVIDPEPRRESDVDPAKVEALEALSRQAVRLIEYRTASRRLAEILKSVELMAPLVPVCAWCERVRDDDRYWESVAKYLESQNGIRYSHGICPECEDARGAKKD